MIQWAAQQVAIWAEMVRFSHSVFALPFALMSTFLAARDLPDRRVPYAGQVVLIVLCMVFARSVAMTFNRIADAAIDRRNPRTADRPIPAGLISTRAAWWILMAFAAAFVATCFGFMRWYENPWPIRLAPAALLFICSYSFAKRFTQWAHFYLGFAIATSPVAAWIAISPSTLGWPALVLMAAVTIWIGGFDVIYACQDIESDQRDGLFSLPARWGPAKALALVRWAHLGTVALLVVLGYLANLAGLYFLGVAIVAVLLTIENAMISPDDFSRINLAFFTLNGAVSLLLGMLAIMDILLLGP
jgi:4-hydroxybenzoate polyprenyltransferase